MPLGASRLTSIALPQAVAPSETGSSALFDGTGDRLYVGTTLLSVGTGAFTLECWFNASTVNSQFRRILTTSNSGIGAQVVMRLTNANKIQAYCGNSAGQFGTGTTTIVADTWYHLAMTRSAASANTKVYLNGQLEIELTSSASLASPGNDVLYIGGYYSVTNGEHFIGNIDEVRVSYSQRYINEFAPPEIAFVDDTDTELLLHMDGTDGSTTFTDSSSNNLTVTVEGDAQIDTAVFKIVDGATRPVPTFAQGDAQIDTAQSKFGGASALFDGTEDYLTFSSQPVPSSGDFTIEFWYRPTAIGTLRPIWSMKDTGGTHRGTLFQNAVGGLTWWTPAINANATSFGNLSANTWYHIACVKDGTQVRIAVNGTMNSYTSTPVVGDEIKFGKADYSGSVFGDEVYAHIDEIRISNVARYSAGFTAPTTAFTNDADTTMLLHCDGTDTSTVFTDDDN